MVEALGGAFVGPGGRLPLLCLWAAGPSADSADVLRSTNRLLVVDGKI